MRRDGRALLVAQVAWVGLLISAWSVRNPAVLVVAAGMIGAVSAAWAAHREPAQSRVWRRMAAAMLLWSLADGCRALAPDLALLADGLRLAGFAHVGWAILLISGRDKRDRILDVAIVCLATGVWVLEAMPPVLRMVDLAGPAILVDFLSYPFCDVLLFGCTVHLTLRRSDGNRSLRLIAVALFVVLVGDVVLMRSVAAGEPLPDAWVVTSCVAAWLLAAAALHADRRTIGRFHPDVPVPRRAVVLALAVVSGPAVMVVHSLRGGPFAPLLSFEVLVLAMLIAVRVALLVTGLGRHVRSDALTGALSRSALVRELEHDDGGYAVLFCDVDRFKAINDSYGHDAGDRVLQVMAERISRQLRAGDLIARFGGDEFVVVCRGVVSQRDTDEVADRIRRSLSRSIDLGRHGAVVVTMSVGPILVRPGESFDAALRRADAEMYRRKRDGRLGTDARSSDRVVPTAPTARSAAAWVA